MSSFTMLATNHWVQLSGSYETGVDAQGKAVSLLYICDGSDATIRQDLPMTPFSVPPNLNSIEFPDWTGASKTVLLTGDKYAIQIPAGIESVTYRMTISLKPDVPMHAAYGFMSWVTDLAVTKQIPDRVFVDVTGTEYLCGTQEITLPPSLNTTGTGVRWLMPVIVVFNAVPGTVVLRKGKLSITRVLRA